MSKAADVFLRNDHQPAPLHANVFYRHARAPRDELHDRGIEQIVEKLQTFAFFQMKIQQHRRIIYSVMYFSIATIWLLDFDASEIQVNAR